MDEEVNRDDNGEADGMNLEVDSKDEGMGGDRSIAVLLFPSSSPGLGYGLVVVVPVVMSKGGGLCLIHTGSYVL